MRLLWFSLERNAELESWATRLVARLREPEHDAIISHLCVALVNCADSDPDALLRDGERAARLLEKTGEPELAASIGAQIAVGLGLCGRFAEAAHALTFCNAWLANGEGRGTYSHLNALLNRSGVYRQLGQFDAARTDIAYIRAAIDASNDPDNHFNIYARLSLAATEFAGGDASLAVQLTRDVISEFRPASGEPTFWEAVSNCNLASYFLAVGQLDDARTAATASLRDLDELDMGCEELFLYLAVVFAREADLPRAAKLLGFIDAWLDRTGYVRGPTDAAFYAEVTDALCALPASDTAALMQFGGHQTAAQITAVAGTL